MKASVSVVPFAPRHKPGRGSHIKANEREDILRAWLTQPDTTTTTLALQFGRTREAISRIITQSDFTKLREQTHTEMVQRARDILHRSMVRAADKWAREAIDAAAKKGDHRPMKDLLTATHVIDLKNHDSHVTVQIGLSLEDLQGDASSSAVTTAQSHGHYP